MVSDDRRCPAVNREGNPCTAFVQPGKTHCAWHDEDRRREMEEARRRGGVNRSTRNRARKLLRQSAGMSDIQAQLMLAMEDVRAGDLDPSVATAMATLARAIVTVAGVAEFEGRLDTMQREITDLKGAG